MNVLCVILGGDLVVSTVLAKQYWLSELDLALWRITIKLALYLIFLTQVTCNAEKFSKLVFSFRCYMAQNSNDRADMHIIYVFSIAIFVPRM